MWHKKLFLNNVTNCQQYKNLKLSLKEVVIYKTFFLIQVNVALHADTGRIQECQCVSVSESI